MSVTEIHNAILRGGAYARVWYYPESGYRKSARTFYWREAKKLHFREVPYMLQGIPYEGRATRKGNLSFEINGLSFSSALAPLFYAIEFFDRAPQ